MSKKYMHPSRKKILDVAFNRDNSGTNTHGWSATKQDRAIGEEWTDSDGVTWVQEKGFKIVKSKFDGIRQYIQSLSTCKNKNCKTAKKTEKHLKFIRKTGYCIDCLAEKEQAFRVKGNWNEYEKWKIASFEIEFLNDLVKKFNEALVDVNKEHVFANSDGTTEKWTYDGDLEELKANISKDILEAEENITGYQKIKDDCWEIIKEDYADVFKE